MHQNLRRLGAALLASIALALALVAFNSRGEPSELAVKAVKQTAGLQVGHARWMHTCSCWL